MRYLVAPVRFHVWRLARWKEFFPTAEVWGPPDLRNGFQGISFDGVLGDEPPNAWAKDLDHMIFRGNPFAEEVEFIHAKSRTLIITDFIQEQPGVLSYLARSAIRLSTLRKALARRSLSELLSWDFDKLIVAHGPNIERDGKRFVEEAFRWLSRA